ncbi:uncharacterized protein [Euwallacea fornicatus]|uniref:uncharacterized protein n=1 Tax=Euwallacea fornicatus TaxID=995702 RepID=UPI00338F75AE
MSSLGVSDVDFGDHGVIYITSASEKEKPIVSEWTANASQDFIRVFQKYLEWFTKGKLPSKKRVFECVAKDLKEMGYSYTSPQCENKWKTVKRRYFHRFEKARRGEPIKGMKFQEVYEDEVAHCLALERPGFKKELERSRQWNNSSLLKKSDAETSDEESTVAFEIIDATSQDYTRDDSKLLEEVMNGEDDEEEDAEDNKQNVFKNIAALNASSKQEKLFQDMSLGGIRSVLKRNLAATNEILKSSTASQEQLIVALESMERREEEKLELKRRKLDVQGDLVQQIKIQNSLMAKLIQKLGSTNNGK